MSKKPSVSVNELLHEINHGQWDGLKPETRQRLTRMIETMVANIAARKAVAPKKIRNTKSTQLMSLEEWEAKHYGKLNVGIMDTWLTEKVLCKRQVAQLIEEFRTEMISKNKQYADFKAAFQVYLTKGYLSKTIDQVKAKPGENSRWGNVATTRGATL